MQNLYTVSTEIEEILESENCLDPITGELTEEASARLNELFISRDDLVEGLAYYCVDLKAAENALKAEIDRLKERLDSAKLRQERIREFINNSTPPDYKLKTDMFSIYKSSSTKLIMSDADPEKYKDSGYVKAKYDWDREGIKKMMKEQAIEQMIAVGDVTCELVKSKHVVIK